MIYIFEILAFFFFFIHQKYGFIGFIDLLALVSDIEAMALQASIYDYEQMLHSNTLCYVYVFDTVDSDCARREVQRECWRAQFASLAKQPVNTISRNKKS